jgi:predicted transcriptional regulator
MPPEDPTADVIDIMLRRDGLIESLLEGPKDKRELVAALDISRSTVDRGVRELDALGLIEPCEEGYRPTLSGRLLAEEYELFSHRIESMVSAREMLSVLPPDSEIDPVVLEGAEFIPSNRVAPHVPGSRLERLLREADQCRILSRAHAHAGSTEMIYEQVLGEDLNIEAVFRNEMLDYTRSSYPERFRQSIIADRYEVFVRENLPFGLYLIERADETRLCVGIYDEDNTLRGLIINDSAAAVEWGERTYRNYKKSAERVDL